MSTLRLYFDLGGDSGRYLHQLCDRFEQQHGVEIQRTNLEIHVLQEQLPRGHDLPEMALLPSDMISWADTLQLSAIPAQWQLPRSLLFAWPPCNTRVSSSVFPSWPAITCYSFMTNAGMFPPRTGKLC